MFILELFEVKYFLKVLSPVGAESILSKFYPSWEVRNVSSWCEVMKQTILKPTEPCHCFNYAAPSGGVTHRLYRVCDMTRSKLKMWAVSLIKWPPSCSVFFTKFLCLVSEHSEHQFTSKQSEAFCWCTAYFASKVVRQSKQQVCPRHEHGEQMTNYTNIFTTLLNQCQLLWVRTR